MPILLEIKDLRTYFHSDDGIARAVDGISFNIEAGKTLGIVGESGCGKTVCCLSILRLIQIPPGEIAGGKVIFKDMDLLRISEEEMQHIRGNEIAMIFQEPMTSLNPVFTCGDQVIEAVTLHQKVTVEEARRRALEMFKLVNIPDPERRLIEYPHQLSGGLRQRVMIAMALSCHPSLLICDEPTTALDVTIQAQILALLQGLQRELGMAIIIITHDLGVIAEMADRVVVMYAGKVVETGDAVSIFHHPQHPYTIGLQHAIPRMGMKKDRLYQIDGVVPNPLEFPAGCKFHPRCPLADSLCMENEPELKPGKRGSQLACWKMNRFEVEDMFKNL